jgi:hypothetical protein
LLDPIAGKAKVRCPVNPWSYGAELVLNRPERIFWRYMLIVELVVSRGVIGVGLLNVPGDNFLFRTSLAAEGAAQTVRIPIPTFSQVGRLIIQNWDSRGESNVELLSIRLLREAD